MKCTEVCVDLDPARRREMEARAGRRSVPQIFIGDLHVGGWDDLYVLERQGRLDELLSHPLPVNRGEGKGTSCACLRG